MVDQLKKRQPYHGVRPCTCTADEKGSDGQGWCAVGIARVETAFAFGAEQVRHAHGGLAQHQLETALLALRAEFAHVAEGKEGQRGVLALEVVDYHQWVEFTENQATDALMLASAGGCVIGVFFRVVKIHRYGSHVW